MAGTFIEGKATQGRGTAASASVYYLGRVAFSFAHKHVRVDERLFQPTWNTFSTPRRRRDTGGREKWDEHSGPDARLFGGQGVRSETCSEHMAGECNGCADTAAARRKGSDAFVPGLCEAESKLEARRTALEAMDARRKGTRRKDCATRGLRDRLEGPWVRGHATRTDFQSCAWREGTERDSRTG
ncbi:hypothetical protein ERJ75_000583700 [Trypanosoma vivax]|nr:hypothetical protein ERJ75_000583700 [Trypanosoma vivax]